MARTAVTRPNAKAAAKKAASKAAAPKQSPKGKTAAKTAAKPTGAAVRRAAGQTDATVRALAERLADALKQLQSASSVSHRDGLKRYAIPTDRAFGVPMASIQAIAKRLRRDRELAAALWDSGWYEARLLASYIDDPALVTAAQMDRWCRDFDNWAVCDTICFVLFDRSPLAWRKIEQWAPRRDEYVRRAAFAMLASKTVHDKTADDAMFLHGLELIEAQAGDERNFVKKSINWALRSIGKRNAALHRAAVAVATRLAASEQAAPRWVGKDALRELRSAAVLARLARRAG
ncbi:MAG: DNA alkylation repair protein [Lysobacter sp.]